MFITTAAQGFIGDGHGDTLVIADAFYPSASLAKKADGILVERML
ncbi:MAG: hypothetical protein ACLVKR_00740 [Lachnospiraceae bacterium]